MKKFWNNIIRKIQRKFIIQLPSPAKSSFKNVHTEVFQIQVVCVLSHIGFIFTEIKNLRWRFVKKVKKELRYPQVLREDKIADCSSRFLNAEMLLALYNMIGLGETGLFTEINRNWEKIEESINF